jgi:quercetin dioxygenase-like cupin family protein
MVRCVASGEPIQVGAMTVRFLVEESSATVFEVAVPVDAMMPAPHSHDGFEETVYGLEGKTTYTIDGEQVEIGPGDAVCVKRGSVHGFVNSGTTDAKFLAIASPGVFGSAFFRDIGGVLAESAGGPPDRDAIGEVMRKHGLTPAPPPA